MEKPILNKKEYTALFTDRKSGSLLHRLQKASFNFEKWPGYTKYEWEKEKALVLEKLVKERFLNKADIEITDDAYSNV